MKQFSIYHYGESWNLHTPDHQVIACTSFHHAAVCATEILRASRLMWWTDWTTYRPLGGRVRYQRNAIVTPSSN